MIEMKNTVGFDGALYALPPRLSGVLINLPDDVKNNVQEIRLRRSCPLTLTLAGRSVWIRTDGTISVNLDDKLLIVYDEEVESCFRLLCRGSVYSHEEEIKNGFIRMYSGHRAGICGRVVGSNLSDITSVNIRIARQIFGAADSIIKRYAGEGLLIAGAPGSGKTTVLRDLIRQLSCGVTGKFYKIAVIDTRGELSGAGAQGTVNDLGPGCDILLDCEKGEGLQMAVRTLGPDLVAFDEIGTSAELEGVKQGIHTGVGVITTAHAGSIQELMSREITRDLILSGAVSTVVFLKGVGEPPLIYSAATNQAS